MKILLLLLFFVISSATGASLNSGFAGLPLYLELPIADSGKVKTGSGFLMYESNHVFLVTAKHVLFDVNARTKPLPLIGTNLLAVGWDAQGTGRLTMTINIGAYRANNEVRYSENRDVAVALVGNSRPDSPQIWLDRRFVATSGATNLVGRFNVGMARRLKDVNVAEDVFTFGYPTSLGTRFGNRVQIDRDRPLAKRGIISDKDPVRRRYVLDLPVYFGNSGGPVIAIRDVSLGIWENHLIGVVSEFIPFEDVWTSERYQLPNVTWANSGYSIAEPIDYVIELLW